MNRRGEPVHALHAHTNAFLTQIQLNDTYLLNHIRPEDQKMQGGEKEEEWNRNCRGGGRGGGGGEGGGEERNCSGIGAGVGDAGNGKEEAAVT